MTIAHHQSRPFKRQRRTATAVLAGDFDPRPARDVLTSVLNGVSRYELVEGADAASKRSKKMEQRDRDRERLRAKRAEERAQREAQAEQSQQQQAGPSVSAAAAAMPPPPPLARSSLTPIPHVPAARLGVGRPAIHMASAQRSVSVTPPPMPSSPASTPGPSISSSTSRQSSKRLHTPDDDEDLHSTASGKLAPVPERKPPKKRVAARKGWKGWVEGSPPPSDKLINLDFAPILTSRRTRSGKSFDS